jgi:hypothetical protein
MALDPIFEAWLEENCARGLALARDSDLLELTPVGGNPPQKYRAEFRCRGLIRDAGGNIVEADRFLVGISFPEDYQDEADAYRVFTWLEPRSIWQSNILPPLVCLTHLAPGSELVTLLHGVFELVTWQKYATHDALNQPAAQWARNRPVTLPVDKRPLKWRATDLRVGEVEAGA